MASWGTILGAVFGRVTNETYRTDGTVLAIISAAVVFVLVAYVLFVLGTFSFSKTIGQFCRPSTSRSSKEKKEAATRGRWKNAAAGLPQTHA